MLDSEVVLPIVSQALVERPVLLVRDVRGVASPDGLGLVELLVLDSLLLDLLGLLWLVLLVLDLLNLGLLVLLLFRLLLVLNLLRVISQHQWFPSKSKTNRIPSQPPWSPRAGSGRR